jgi:hypothetical protein
MKNNGNTATVEIENVNSRLEILGAAVHEVDDAKHKLEEAQEHLKAAAAEYSFDKHIPIPKNTRQTKKDRKYAFLQAMNVGDSKFLPVKRGTAQASIYNPSNPNDKAALEGKRFRVRGETFDGVEGCRVWRTA